MGELATLTRNRVVPAGTDEQAAFEVLAEPTPLQARAFELMPTASTRPDREPGAGLTDRHLFDIMEHMRTIGGLELDVLLAVARSQGPAYGLSVRDEVGRARGREYSVGAIYTTLARLEDKGLVAGRSTEPLPVRGGRSRREYDLTTAAREVLAAERERSARRWDTEPHRGQA